MIPKKIHYCWFGGKPLPRLAKKCIKSWKKYLPDYEIIRWDESNFDVNIIPYTKEAYEAKKYAFVSDYARFWILYKEGGIYFDTDVEVIKSFKDIIDAGPFMGRELTFEEAKTRGKIGVNPGLGLGVFPGHIFFHEMLDLYSNIHFPNSDNTNNPTTVVTYTTEALLKYGLKNTTSIQKVIDINIYPSDYFSPLSFITKKLTITNNTHSIHLFAGSWISRKTKMLRYLDQKYPVLLYSLVTLKKFILRK